MRHQKRSLLIPILVALVAGGCVGPPGPAGPAGPAGVAEYEVIVGETLVDNTAQKQLQVDCPGSKKALGAGWSVLDSTGAILSGRATYFQPAFDGSHWLTNAENKSTFEADWKLRVRVICAAINS